MPDQDKSDRVIIVGAGPVGYLQPFAW